MTTFHVDHSDGHEPLAQDYMYNMSLVELADLARRIGIDANSLVRRALALRHERFRAMQGLLEESSK